MWLCESPITHFPMKDQEFMLTSSAKIAYHFSVFWWLKSFIQAIFFADVDEAILQVEGVEGETVCKLMTLNIQKVKCNLMGAKEDKV